MKPRLLFIPLATAVFLSAMNIAGAQDGASATKIENGIIVKTGAPLQTSSSLAPEKKAAEQREDFPIGAAAKAAAANGPAAGQDSEDEEFINDSESPEMQEITMKPIIDKSSRAKKSENKIINNNPVPFKKSQDTDANETINKPAPKPEVSGKPLPDYQDNISAELQNLDVIKKNKDKATNAEDGVGESGLPIPRFVSLKSGEANARTGPGDSYPIRWVYQRKNLPVEVTAEFKLWRRIKDFDGEQSWVHQVLLASHRYCILQRDANAQSDYDGGHNTARFKRGVQVALQSCKKDACKVKYGDIEGWLKKKDLWGVYAAEVFD